MLRSIRSSPIIVCTPHNLQNPLYPDLPNPLLQDAVPFLCVSPANHVTFDHALSLPLPMLSLNALLGTSAIPSISGSSAVLSTMVAPLWLFYADFFASAASPVRYRRLTVSEWCLETSCVVGRATRYLRSISGSIVYIRGKLATSRFKTWGKGI